MATKIRYPGLPIIYVRGFAASMSEIDQTTADPYMGFNLGSTMLRQDAAKDPVRFIFESPLLRLIKDHGYEDAFRHGSDSYDPGTAPAQSIWIYRYYEQSSDTLGTGKLVPIEQFAADLRAFILNVRDAICGDDADERKKFGVYLVAHSMGGLVCRCYLQNICRHGAPKAEDNTALELVPGKANPHYVDKLYTYATPHNGIDMFGMNTPQLNLAVLGAHQTANFNRVRMREYLKISSPAVGVNDLDGAFAAERCFCLVGSDNRDYEAFFGLSKKGTGPMSDGLVMMKNAWVKGAPRAVTYRSHSGFYGIVNSEAGYQNLRRLLFGDEQVTALLCVDALPLSRAVQAKKDAGAEVRGSYYFDVVARVRAAATFALNEQRYEQGSSVLKTYDELTADKKPVFLFTGYLLAQARLASDTALMFAIDVGIRVPAFEIDKKFWFDEHFEGFLYRDTITFAVRAGSIRYGLASANGIGSAPTTATVTATADGGREIRIPLATKAGVLPGFQGHLVLQTQAWNAAPES
ncbi:MAG TPA: hypothetical protein VFX38_05025 [Gammaproteobacteria bacterium]|nr:hypothetical protein [Gammaproteobacteria bacterium]